MSQKGKTTSMYLSEATVEQLDAYRDHLGDTLSRSQVVENALEEYLKNHNPHSPGWSIMIAGDVNHALVVDTDTIRVKSGVEYILFMDEDHLRRRTQTLAKLFYAQIPLGIRMHLHALEKILPKILDNPKDLWRGEILPVQSPSVGLAAELGFEPTLAVVKVPLEPVIM